MDVPFFLFLGAFSFLILNLSLKLSFCLCGNKRQEKIVRRLDVATSLAATALILAGLFITVCNP